MLVRTCKALPTLLPVLATRVSRIAHHMYATPDDVRTELKHSLKLETVLRMHATFDLGSDVHTHGLRELETASERIVKDTKQEAFLLSTNHLQACHAKDKVQTVAVSHAR